MRQTIGRLTNTCDLPDTAGIPNVSIIIPCRQEGAFIGNCLESIARNDYPKDRLEVLVVDGMSHDETRSVVSALAEKYPFIRLVENPKQITPAALNAGIAHARGEIIMWIGAHAQYPPDYVSKCVTYLRTSGADNVGGVMKTAPRVRTLVAQAIAYAMSHRLGAGTAAFRSGTNAPKWVDTVFGGCCRREVFQKVGLFNEGLLKTQDREFNDRLRNTGGRILLVPEIQCTYYARAQLGEYARYMFISGFWPFWGSRLAGRRFVSLRNFVPLFFVLSCLGSSGLAIAAPAGRYLLGGILAIYLLAVVLVALPLARAEKDVRYLALAPWVFAVTHVSYGIGSMWGILKALTYSFLVRQAGGRVP